MESNAQNLKRASEEGICDPIICPSSKEDLKYSSNQDNIQLGLWISSLQMITSLNYCQMQTTNCSLLKAREGII